MPLDVTTMKSVSRTRRQLSVESLESRQMLDASLINDAMDSQLIGDVDGNGTVDYPDFLALARAYNTNCDSCPEDLDGNGVVGFPDFLVMANNFGSALTGGAVSAAAADDVFSVPKAPGVDDGSGGTFAAMFNQFERDDLGDLNLLTTGDVETLLSRASMATASNDAIIAIVDRSGRILGVRVEEGVNADLLADSDEARDKLAFAIDGAVAKARTAAFFSSNAAPLTSRTIRFISQSTITQREVESSPLHADPRYQGPGLVAPIGVGGHFPPEIPYTPQVDLFAIEHQSRDSQTHPGKDGIKGNADDFDLYTRFNADPTFVPKVAEQFFTTWPESYGEQSGISQNSIPRGIATLPGGVPLFKTTTKFENGDVVPFNNPIKPSEFLNLVGGIGVFFPGEDGFATHEQAFQHGIGQTEKYRTNAPRVLEAEFAAFIAAAGGGVEGPNAFKRDLSKFNKELPPLPNFILPVSRIDLVGLTLEIYGPTPDRSFRKPGIDRLIDVGMSVGRGVNSSRLEPDPTVVAERNELVEPGQTLLAGQPVPEKWLVAPHASSMPNGLSAQDVEDIIMRGITEADRTRAAIRLDFDKQFRPGPRTSMVLAVADTNGELLGLFRMEDATIFSIDVSVAKSRNTAYYADEEDLIDQDRVDFNSDEVLAPISTSTKDRSGDSFDPGTALTNRSFRFLAEPRFPTGIELPNSLGIGLQNSDTIDLCDQRPVACLEVGPQSMLRLPGINPLTAENIDDKAPQPIEVYADRIIPLSHRSTVAFDSFNVMRNFRDPGDLGVIIAGSDQVGPAVEQPLANQNGVVFFPGSTPLYVDNRETLAGGFGVSGDGVDQDDVVTSAGQQGFDPLQSIRVDTFTIGGVRVPFQHFNRNPFGA